ncbi:MAG TPA: VOC family protein [Planctomycetota bacterium]|jgi:hypothetical protein
MAAAKNALPGQLDYLEINVKDLAESKAFYGYLFGWTFLDQGTEYTCFTDGRLRGGFQLTRRPLSGGGIVPVLYASDLDGAKQRIQSSGGRVVRDTFFFPGGRRFHFVDPSGNEIGVWSDH